MRGGPRGGPRALGSQLSDEACSLTQAKDADARKKELTRLSGMKAGSMKPVSLSACACLCNNYGHSRQATPVAAYNYGPRGCPYRVSRRCRRRGPDSCIHPVCLPTMLTRPPIGARSLGCEHMAGAQAVACAAAKHPQAARVKALSSLPPYPSPRTVHHMREAQRTQQTRTRMKAGPETPINLGWSCLIWGLQSQSPQQTGRNCFSPPFCRRLNDKSPQQTALAGARASPSLFWQSRGVG